jgi:signal recognition particle GTPase
MGEVLTPAEVEAMREAVERRRREESFEQALGRALRRQDLDYEAYIKLISQVRERAGKDRKDLFPVAEAWLRELFP